MRAILIVSAAFALMACEGLTGGNGISESDVDNISAGDAVGVVFTGKWDLQTEVTESSCIGIPGLPVRGEKEDDSVTFAQSGGSLTRIFDEFGDSYRFNGAVNQDGTFIYGDYYSFSLAGIEFRRVEIVDGRVELNSGGGESTMTGTANRRFQGGIIDCSATIAITGERGSVTGGE
ncbi:MAG: hypothetical protein ACI9U2_002808 [Bradymonadia bacterium]|jgi:hypothetical protein